MSNDKIQYFMTLIEKDGDSALNNARYLNISADEVIQAYNNLNLRPPITIVKSPPNPYSERGWGNGYVRITEGHPYYEKNYDDIPVDVHGGLTFSDNIFGDSKHFSDGYWIGFDTAHYGDTKERWPMDRVMSEAKHLLKQVYHLK